MPDGIRILFAEDLETDAELSLRALSRAGVKARGIRADTAETFRQRLEAVPRPDLILSDYSMPSFDGFSALKIAREMAPEVPFIFVSGTIGEENAIRALKEGATDYVLKQNLLRLPAAVERALREAQDRALARRRDAEDRKLKSLIAAIVELTPTPLVVMATDATILIVNPAFTALSGWGFGDLAGKDARELVPEENGQMLHQLARSGSSVDPDARFECYMRMKRGDLIGVRFSVRDVMMDGQAHARVAFIEQTETPASGAAAPISPAAFERSACDLATRLQKLTGIVAGRIVIEGLAKISADKRRHGMDAAFAAIARALGPRDVVTESGDGFLIAFYDQTPEEADLKCRFIQQKIDEFFAAGTAPSHAKLAAVSADDVARAGSFAGALDERIGAGGAAPVRPDVSSIELESQRRKDRLLGEVGTALKNGKIVRFDVNGPRGAAADVDCLDFDRVTMDRLMQNIGFLQSDTGLLIESNMVRLESAVSHLIADPAGAARKHHLTYLSIETLRDPAARRRFVSLWKLIPTDLQRRIILCFQDVDQGLAPVAVENAILQIAGLVFNTGIVLVEPALPGLDLQLIKTKVVILDLHQRAALGRPIADAQCAALVRAAHQRGCKVFLRAPPAAGRLSASQYGVDGMIAESFKTA